MNSRFSQLKTKWPVRLVTSLLFGLLLGGYSCGPEPVFAQTPVVLAPLPQLQFFTQTGLPLAFGCIFTYQSGTTTPFQTYTDSTGVTQNQNPVILSAGGSANIWLTAGQAYTFKVKSSGGTQCASGQTLYTVNGIGGGTSQLTTAVTYSSTPTFAIAAQNQLFTITLTGDASSQPISAVTGLLTPALVAWEITQDGVGAHAFTWPANSIGGCTIGKNANQVTLQFFVWDGTNAIATGPCVTGNGPIISAGNIYDYGVSISSPLCTDTNKQIVSACNSVLGIIVNGQTINPGGSGNVNAGAAAHSMAINEGAGAPIAGVLLGAHQTGIGQAGADPAAKTIPDCQDTSGNHLNFTQSSDTFNCGTSTAGAGFVKAKVNVNSCALAPNGGGEWSCNGTITWGVTLSTTTYYGECSLSCPGGAGSCGSLAGGYDAHFFWTSKSTTTMGYTINDDHSGSNGVTYNLSCIAVE